MDFRIASHKPVNEFLEAKSLGFMTRPVLLGPVSFVLLGKDRSHRLDRGVVLKALLKSIEFCYRIWSGTGRSGYKWTSPALAWI